MNPRAHPIHPATTGPPVTALVPQPALRVATAVLWRRLALARADIWRWQAAGDSRRLRDARFVAATLVLRIAHRLSEDGAALRGPAPLPD